MVRKPNKVLMRSKAAPHNRPHLAATGSIASSKLGILQNGPGVRSKSGWGNPVDWSYVKLILSLVEIRVTNTACIHLSAVDCYIAIRVSSR